MTECRIAEDFNPRRVCDRSNSWQNMLGLKEWRCACLCSDGRGVHSNAATGLPFSVLGYSLTDTSGRSIGASLGFCPNRATYIQTEREKHNLHEHARTHTRARARALSWFIPAHVLRAMGRNLNLESTWTEWSATRPERFNPQERKAVPTE
jgi:hypothetical protein